METDNEASSTEGGPAIPAGVLRTSRKGWAGEEMEIAHLNDQSGKDAYAAVDIKQFQNTIVGEGYQARGVIRQKNGSEGQSSQFRDFTSKTTSYLATTQGGGTIARKGPQESNITGTGTTRKELDDYLRCDGLREFRKEIEQLLNSSK